MCVMLSFCQSEERVLALPGERSHTAIRKHFGVDHAGHDVVNWLCRAAPFGAGRSDVRRLEPDPHTTKSNRPDWFGKSHLTAAEDYATSIMGDPDDFVEYCRKLSDGSIPPSDLMPALKRPEHIDSQIEEERDACLRAAFENTAITYADGPRGVMEALSGVGVYDDIRGGLQLHAHIKCAYNQVYLSGSVVGGTLVEKSIPRNTGVWGADILTPIGHSCSLDMHIEVDTLTTMRNGKSIMVPSHARSSYTGSPESVPDMEVIEEKLMPRHVLMGSASAGWYMFPANVRFDLRVADTEPLQAEVEVMELGGLDQMKVRQTGGVDWLSLWADAFEEPECRIEEWKDVRDIKVDTGHEFFAPSEVG